MIFVLGISDKNCFLASRMYEDQFPESISFSRLLERLNWEPRVQKGRKE